MADEGGRRDVHLLKSTKISVYVDEALPDILVVTFEFGVQIFKGVLLDTTKKNIPCGIPNLNPVFDQKTKSKPDDDPLFAVNQRFAYTDPSHAKKKNVQVPTKFKNSKMTVRLRPRQVLCTKCKGICNENSENVTRKRKTSETVHSPPPPIKRGVNGPITRSTNNNITTPQELNKKKSDPKRSLIPKSSPDLPNALSGNVNKLNIDNNKKPLTSVPNTNTCDNNVENNVIDTHSLEHSDNLTSVGKVADSKVKRILRKKRSIGSMDDSWEDSNSLEETNKNNNINNGSEQQPLCSNTRTIKISYGPQGEGTVLKIPAQIENLSNDGLEENVNIDEVKEKDNEKAVRKAMKKARKEAKRKTVLPNSPERMSPRYALGASSPRYTVGSASPRHGLGSHSPRYVSVILEPNTPKKRKHKMKHKKKHREDKDRKHKEGEVSSSSAQDESSKEQCLTQKLSINLKRLSASYTTMPVVTNDEEEDSSSDDLEQVPNFPATCPSLVHINGTTASLTSPKSDSDKLLVGDVVWGKITGFPWWPAKVLTITQSESVGTQAMVAWYGSSTSSLMQCDQLNQYLDHFKIHYNKKKRGAYKEAVRQASNEARLHAEMKNRETALKSSPARNIIPVVPPALASPREINLQS